MPDAVKLQSGFVIHLNEGLGINARAATAEFWADRDRCELATGRLLSVFTYSATWDYQERHPDGDELVVVLAGATELLLDVSDGGGEQSVPLVDGDAAVIPTGAWHRAAVRHRCTLLFITPEPARTEHRTLTVVRSH